MGNREIVHLKQEVDAELHVGKRRLRHLPELVLLRSDVGPDRGRVHPPGGVTSREVRREVLVHRVVVAAAIRAL